MKYKKLSIILLILLIISIGINFYLISIEKFDKNEKEKKINEQYKITMTFMLVYPENNEIKYYSDMNKEFMHILTSSKNKSTLYSKYEIDISNNINIDSMNETNTLYKVTIFSEKQENLVNIGKDVMNILITQSSEIYNMKIQFIDGAYKDSITKVK